MKKPLFPVLLALMFVGVTAVHGLAHAEFQVPELTGRVVDAGSVFSEDEAQRIEQAILRLEEATGGQLVVATLPTLDGLPIEEVGIKLGDTWKIGHQGEDNGAILLFVVPERKMRLEIGRGWEGPINDARAGDVIRGLKPYFRVEKYTDGAIWAVEKVQEFVTGEAVTESLVNPEVQEDVAHQLELAEDEEKKAEDHPWWAITLGVLVFLGLMAILLGACWQGLWLFGLLLVILWSVFVYVVLFPVVWLLFWPLRKTGIPLPKPKPSWFQSEWLLEFFELDSFSSTRSSSSDSSSSRSRSSYSSSDYSSSSHSSSGSSYSGGGGKFGGGGASGGW